MFGNSTFYEGFVDFILLLSIIIFYIFMTFLYYHRQVRVLLGELISTTVLKLYIRKTLVSNLKIIRTIVFTTSK